MSVEQKKVVHYWKGFNVACGRGGISVWATKNVNEVTCQKCKLTTIYRAAVQRKNKEREHDQD